MASEAPQVTKLVAVNSAGADAFGPFKLKSSQVTPYDGKPLGAGNEAIDWLMGDKQDYTLKVDKAGRPKAAEAVIDLAHNFSLRVVAEGVEDEKIAHRLTELRCDVLQGYLFDRPLMVQDFEKRYLK